MGIVKNSLVVLYVVYPKNFKLKKHIELLLKDKLIVCANVLSTMESYYVWNGNAESTKEIVVIYKTLKSKEKKLIFSIEKQHPYDVPFIASLGAVLVNKSYLNFAIDQIRI